MERTQPTTTGLNIKTSTIRYMVEIVRCIDEYYWRIYDDKEEMVASSHKWYKSKSECIHAVNVLGHHFKNAIISEEVVNI